MIWPLRLFFRRKHKDTFTCPRRKDPFASGYKSTTLSRPIPAQDYWHKDNTCSYCGSLHPQLFMLACMSPTQTLVPTDKNYKVYVNPGYQKFYFQHLDAHMRSQFTELLNKKLLHISDPGHFHVLPYFLQATHPS